MNEFKRILTSSIENDKKILNQIISEKKHDHIMKALACCELAQKELNNYYKTGVLNLVKVPEKFEDKENAVPNIAVVEEKEASVKRGPTKKGNDCEKKTDKESIINNKLTVKLERLDLTEKLKTTENIELNMENIKIENEEMPAPKQLPPRRKKTNKNQTKVENVEEVALRRTLRSTVKKEKNPEPEDRPLPTRTTRSKKALAKVKQSRQNSDVIIEEKPIEVINLDDSNEIIVNEAKTNKSKKRFRDADSDNENQQKEKRSSASCSSEENRPKSPLFKSNIENKTLVNNELNSPPSSEVKTNNNFNETYVTTANTEEPFDKTVVIPKETPVTNINKNNKNSPPVKTKANQIFSPYESSPVKKKVEAFEKLAEKQTASTAKSMRSKKIINTPIKYQSSGIKEKTNKFQTPTLGEISISQKSISALKASQKEYREAEKRRQEREVEARRKREEMLQAQIEEKKRKREEKELKVQQLKEQQKLEKLKSIEAQKLKEERHKQILQEQEEKKQKIREEAEKKRLLAKKRALEEKKKEEEELRKLEELKNQKIKEKKKEEELKLEEEKRINAKLMKQDAKMLSSLNNKPAYMVKQAPYLPTAHCYDSDESGPEDIPIVKWAEPKNLLKIQKIMHFSGEKLKNTYFCPQPQSVDLIDIFKIVDPKKLKRTSSACWKKPPRYTMMPNLQSFPEES